MHVWSLLTVRRLRLGMGQGVTNLTDDAVQSTQDVTQTEAQEAGDVVVHHVPVEPKPPEPLSVSESIVVSLRRLWKTGVKMSWAILSPFLTEYSCCDRLTRMTFTSPL